MKKSLHLTGRCVRFADEEIIVSKTDLQGRITYANDVFMRVAGYREEDLIGAPHNILRHPAMPRGVFRLLWDTVQAGSEIFAYVLNRAANGDEYWVFAHVTPSYDLNGKHVGYHSNRRSPFPDALPPVKQLYAQMLAVESKHKSAGDAAAAGVAFLEGVLRERGQSYAQFVFSLSRYTRLAEDAA